MRFEFSTASRIVFGWGSVGEAVKASAFYGSSVLLVTGMGNALALKFEDDLRTAGLNPHVFHVAQEPSVDLIQRGVSLARATGTEVVVGFGGGSAIDAAKAIAGLAVNTGPILSYLEVVGEGKPLTVPALPLIAVPTTAGTGAEVTRNSVLTVPDHKVKVSLRSPFLIPRIAVVDPNLTVTLPPPVTASTGMDALAQVIEPFVSVRANPLVDAFCREGMARIGRSLLRAYQQGVDPTAREDMSYASLMGGLALANGGLGAVHGFAGPLGGMFKAPHGVICARLLGPVVRMNFKAMVEREPSHPAIGKYSEAAHLFGLGNDQHADELADRLDDLCRVMEIPRLSEIGIRRQDFDELIQKSAVASSMKANPIKLEYREMAGILNQAL